MTTYYHVTSNWDNGDLMCGAQYYGSETAAIERFCAKWGTDDSSYAQDQVTKLYLWASIEEAQAMQEDFGGEILKIETEDLTVFEDRTERTPMLATREIIPADCISRI